jgi:transcription elongation factor Elf1
MTFECPNCKSEDVDVFNIREGRNHITYDIQCKNCENVFTRSILGGMDDGRLQRRATDSGCGRVRRVS